MLRSPDWIADYGAHVGGTVFLDMPEMGVEGLADVIAIEPAPEIEPVVSKKSNDVFNREIPK